MFCGIDLGTSAVKAVIVDDADTIVAEASAPLARSAPQPRWSEQDPADWWTATVAAVRALPGSARDAVRGVGLAGQMHGAVLLDARSQPIRPAILWNDGRAAAQCATFERREPRSRTLSANLAMPGFTAPKLVWVAEHEPDAFRRVAQVLLPKDWLRLKMTGESASEPSDASGTLWLDVGARTWSEALLAASGLTLAAMPRLVEGSEVSGALSREAGGALGLPTGVPVAGGGGDNACGAAGIGVVDDGDALVSFGTSGVIFVADDALRPDPARGVHAFCHCVPGRWHRMAVSLSCMATIAFATRITGAADEAALIAEVEASPFPRRSRLVMLPYLDGERTPHNDASACGVLFGLDGSASRADVGRAALEGIAFAFADGLDALEASGPRVASLAAIGGGSRSPFAGRIVAAALGRPLVYTRHGEVGPARGAARLARIAVDRVSVATACAKPKVERVVEPEPSLIEALAERKALYRSLYRDLAPRFAASVAPDPADAPVRARAGQSATAGGR